MKNLKTNNLNLDLLTEDQLVDTTGGVTALREIGRSIGRWLHDQFCDEH